MDSTLLLPAFSDAVAQTQQTFRLAMTAMSEPGTTQVVDGAPSLDVLAPATYALCLSLLDADTPVWLAPALDTPVLRANLAFHCGCPVVEDRADAAFALLTENELVDLHGFNQGTDRDPDQSCTLFVQLPGLDQGPAVSCRGPGIERERALRLPLASAFWQARNASTAFPKGLDIFFTSGETLMALPRSTRVQYSVQEVV